MKPRHTPPIVTLTRAQMDQAYGKTKPSPVIIRLARQFRPVFDHLVKEFRKESLFHRPVLVPHSTSGVTSASFHVQINDALKYLCSLPEGEPYRALRDGVTFQRTEDGVIIKLKSGVTKLTFIELANASPNAIPDKAEWKGKVLDFIENPPASLSLELSELLLLPDDLEWLGKFLGSVPGLEWSYVEAKLSMKIVG